MNKVDWPLRILILVSLILQGVIMFHEYSLWKVKANVTPKEYSVCQNLFHGMEGTDEKDNA